ncbi:ParD-like family protein [Xenophilus sp. Marseille-Q4582]|uniref:ParD-like family protein n=1 Tax=Xenophilus sp. Marseille-Q4582 TaxID=2866600 RepID=UPI001CE47B9D|nr:ParD-like family protein [Xenophilus sp. Marseille-Q4582]
MPASSSAFASVKLPVALVDRARQSAQPLRRSVASQIEYWATLGQIVESTGLSVQEARAAIEAHEAAARAEPAEALQADAIAAHFLAAEADRSLAQRVREVVAQNRRRAATTQARA